jgi:hypothetical protein
MLASIRALFILRKLNKANDGNTYIQIYPLLGIQGLVFSYTYTLYLKSIFWVYHCLIGINQNIRCYSRLRLTLKKKIKKTIHNKFMIILKLNHPFVYQGPKYFPIDLETTFYTMIRIVDH